MNKCHICTQAVFSKEIAVLSYALNTFQRELPSDSIYCQTCLEKKIQSFTTDLDRSKFQFAKSMGEVRNPIEGIDYYFNEQGLFTMTAWYHLRRGKCCTNDCLHCPYKAVLTT
ncbi:DUF5522 domain-containing protein [Algivirga pacifica]|uniref:Uncharacterized protein n=1 Tax=Algivirga pacifica TaxID=1162670 RepID=A0ABP9DJ89_9BACT